MEQIEQIEAFVAERLEDVGGRISARVDAGAVLPEIEEGVGGEVFGNEPVPDISAGECDQPRTVFVEKTPEVVRRTVFVG